MAWSLQSDRPLYAQLVGQLQRMIVTGVYPAGSRLPSVRELAAEAAVNPNTMQRALVKLEEDGLIFTQRTSGRYVTEEQEKIMETKKKWRSSSFSNSWKICPTLVTRKSKP